MKKFLFVLYSTLCYLIFFATFLYLIGFVENVSRFEFAGNLSPLFSKTLDFGTPSLFTVPAILIDLLLITLFGLQHSVMAREGFKKQWTRIVPPAIERSTYVLFASILLIVLFVFWQPVTIVIWDLSGTTIGELFFALSLIGWILLLISTFLVNHFDLFGLRQSWLYVKGKEIGKLTFRTPFLYKIVRHPIYLSFLIAFWFAPLMTVGHMVFNMGMTAYIFIGILHEERDLVKSYGHQYEDYRLQVPKIIPFSKTRSNHKESHKIGTTDEESASVFKKSY